MFALAATVLVVLLLLLTSEWLWRRHEVDPEYTRKFVHITVGSFVAFWPLFLSRKEIVGLSLAFVIVVLASQYFQVFRAVHSVQRPTWGELLFAVSVGALAYVSHDGWVYLAALLRMSLADGLAAIVGTKFGKTTRYYSFGHAKSAVGSATFFITSLAILAGYSIFTPNPFSLWFFGIAAGATLLEALAIRGLDNLLVPVLVAVALNPLR
ncbi:MAG TPA: hypothetical protein VHC98_00225 [Candidatus Saccharimonadales bacterium]|nr:hypothetical protein [Candidatus Saccharimonadales bacterium]